MSNNLRKLGPEFSIDEAKHIANEYYNLTEFLCQLPSERDQNFLFQRDNSKFILKIFNIDENYSVIDMQNCAMDILNNEIKSLPANNGKKIVEYKNHFLRLVTYFQGIPLAKYQPHTPKLFFNLGKLLANIDKSLANFKHDGATRDLYWNIRNAENIITKYKNLIVNKKHNEIIEKILNDWIEFVVPNFTILRQSVIHNDANDYNIIVHDEDTIGLIDFGDMCQTFLVSEAAIACAYIMLDKLNPLDSALDLVRGYHQIHPLESIEFDLIYYFIVTRLAMSVTISAHQKERQPDNDYINISEKPAWDLLEKLFTFDKNFIQNSFRSIMNC